MFSFPSLDKRETYSVVYMGPISGLSYSIPSAAAVLIPYLFHVCSGKVTTRAGMNNPTNTSLIRRHTKAHLAFTAAPNAIPFVLMMLALQINALLECNCQHASLKIRLCFNISGFLIYHSLFIYLFLLILLSDLNRSEIAGQKMNSCNFVWRPTCFNGPLLS